MAKITLLKLKCVVPEDHGSDGDETYIEIKNKGERKVVWGPRQMRAGDELGLEGLSFEIEDMTIYLWDRDNGQGALIDSDDPLGRHKPHTKPGVHTTKFSDEGSEYYLTYEIT